MLSQLTEQIFGRGWEYYYIQLMTMLILYLAANTSFNGLPPLLSIMAKDSYVPRYLGSRGERLGYSNGIILLSLLAGLLIVAFQGNVEHLISLYAIGVFLSFTIAQTSLVVKWRRDRGQNWLGRALVNGLGAVVTGIVVIIIAVTKFFYGAWIIIIFIPVMISIFRAVHQHYKNTADQLRITPDEFLEYMSLPTATNLIIVPISGLTQVVAETLRYAKSISGDVIALHIYTDEQEGEKIQKKWDNWNIGVQIAMVYSPYRLIIQPILSFVNQLEMHRCNYDYITIIIPEFETSKWWHRLLHNQTGWILRTLLILRDNVIVTTIPYHLKK